MELPGFSLLAAASLFAVFCCYKRQQGRFIFFLFYLDYTKSAGTDILFSKWKAKVGISFKYAAKSFTKVL
jgi:hypothetical protein